jgi:hypothetical protein
MLTAGSSSERDCETAECGCAIIVVTFKAQIDPATARHARNRSLQVRTGCLLCWYAYGRGQLAKRRPELQNPIGLATTYREISGKNPVHRAAAHSAFNMQTRLYPSNSPRISTLFILVGGLLASHCLPLCGSDAAVVAQTKFSGEPERNETRISATPCGVQLNPRTFGRAALARESSPCALRANLRFSSASVFFRVRSEQAPGFQKNVDSGFGERNLVVTRPTQEVEPIAVYVSDESD